MNSLSVAPCATGTYEKAAASSVKEKSQPASSSSWVGEMDRKPTTRFGKSVPEFVDREKMGRKSFSHLTLAGQRGVLAARWGEREARREVKLIVK